MANRYLIKSICSLVFLVALLVLKTSPAMADSTWQQVGGMGFTSNLTSFFLYNGSPYITCTDSKGSVTVMKYDGTSWQQVGSVGLSSDRVYWVSLFVYEGIPYLAYRDDNNLIVMKYDGRLWAPVGMPLEIASTIYNSFYVYQGTPYLACEDGSGNVTVMKFTGNSYGWRPVGDAINYSYNGNWLELGMPGYPGVLAPVSLVVYEGTPYVAVRNTVMKYNGSNWEPVGKVDFLSIKTDYESLCVYNGILYLAYQSQAYNANIINTDHADANDFTPITDGVLEYNGTSWAPLGNNFVNRSYDTPFVTDSLFVYNGTPYIACTDSKGKVTVMKYDGTSWRPVGNTDLSSSQINWVSLFIYNEALYLAYDYYPDANGNYHGSVMKYTGAHDLETPQIEGERTLEPVGFVNKALGAHVHGTLPTSR